jgi:hypothetical protein
LVLIPHSWLAQFAQLASGAIGPAAQSVFAHWPGHIMQAQDTTSSRSVEQRSAVVPVPVSQDEHGRQQLAPAHLYLGAHWALEEQLVSQVPPAQP